MSRGLALLFLGPKHSRWDGCQPHAPAASTLGKDPVSIVQEAGWAPGPVWTVANLVPTGIRSRTVILTELPGPNFYLICLNNTKNLAVKHTELCCFGTLIYFCS